MTADHLTAFPAPDAAGSRTTAPDGAGKASQHGALPRLGFLGVGWIGRHRMEAISAAGCAEIVAVSDPSAEMREAARECAPEAEQYESMNGLLDAGLDGVVIATPSALHAEQAIAALERGIAVFCQKPLGRTAAEASAVVAAARRANVLIGVDFSYRFTDGMQAIRKLLAEGALGRVYAADLVFHNAYGPDKSWFFDPAQSGGGCVMDLGIHLVDLALWALDFPDVRGIGSRLHAGGDVLLDTTGRVEDHAVATLEVEGGICVQLACSWNLHAGQDAVISASFYGTEGGVQMRNVNGSFYDFQTDRLRGTTRESLASPPEAWGGRAAVRWATALAAGARFDPEADRLVQVSNVLDGIYGR